MKFKVSTNNFYQSMKTCWLTVYLILHVLELAFSGHEVLYKHIERSTDIKPNELVIVQFDSRPLDAYWNVSTRWNKAYCDKFGHKYIYISSRENCRYGTHLLSDPWCKVKAMVKVDKLFSKNSEIKAFLYLDSDAVITVNYSMTAVLSYIQQDRNWDMQSKPLAINQDGPGWSCKSALERGYPQCLNSGTVFWMRNPKSSAILMEWWKSAGEPYETANKFTSPWRKKWPWEQAQLYEVLHRHRAEIMVLTFPDLPHLPWTSKANPTAQYPTDLVEPYCFSHWPGAGCFITHHCASKNQKRKLQDNYDLPYKIINFDTYYIEDKRS